MRYQKLNFLGIESNDKLDFNQQINNIYKSVSNQLNALIRPKHLLRFQERKVLANSFKCQILMIAL